MEQILEIIQFHLILQLLTLRLWKGKSQCYSGAELELELDTSNSIHCSVHDIVLTLLITYS